jgi:sugar transferase (PEP-CTERM/EpsH1 system associated)
MAPGGRAVRRNEDAMRILLLTQVVPYPPDSGPKIKTYHVLRYLAQRHEVHLVSFTRSEVERAQAQALCTLCRSVATVPLRRARARDLGALLRSLTSGRPFLIERDESAAMRRAIAEVLDRHPIDAVHADQISMAQFAVDLPVPLRVLDEHNAVWTIVRRSAASEGWGPRRLLAEWEWRRLRAYETDMCRRFDRVTVVSDADAAALALAGPPEALDIIPIAIDTDDLAFTPRPAEARHVLSLATMFYPPNIEGVGWFARAVFPRIRQAHPATRFLIVGSRPPASIRRLATADSGIVVTGYVADLEPLLRQSAVLVAPLHAGSGMRVKILEAFARGIPVVSTTIGAEGIAVQPGEHLLIADDPADFAAAVSRLLARPSEAARLAAAGRRLVEQRYDWRTALRGLDRIYGATGDDRTPARRRGQAAPSTLGEP